MGFRPGDYGDSRDRRPAHEAYCMSCLEPITRAPLHTSWVHVDGAIGAACADARGDQPILPISEKEAFKPIPYDPSMLFK